MMQPQKGPAAFPNAAYQRAERSKPTRDIGVLGWKIRFISISVVMFITYAGLSPLADRMGWRPPRSITANDPGARRDCNAAGMTVEARASCIVARDDARERESKARQEKQNADEVRRKTEQKALDDEITRQREAGKSKKLRAEYEHWIDAVIAGEKRFATWLERTVYLEQTLGVLVKLLGATEGHPAKAMWWQIHNLRAEDALAAINMRGKETPDPDARAEVERVCAARGKGWRAECGELLKKHVLKLPVVVTRFYLNEVIGLMPLTGGK